jgi:hypothetical protein
VAGDLPARRIDRDALDRIIRRAAELQAGEMDTGEELTEAELLKLGAEVGIDGRFLRQALYEQSAGTTSERGFLARWFGPSRISAARVVPGEKAALDLALSHWMTEGEALAVKRRLPDRIVWERQKGFFAEMKRGFGVGGRDYRLAKARDVTVVVTQLEQGYCHVELIADIAPQRNGHVAGGASVAGAGAIVGLGVLAASVVVPYGLIAAAVSAGTGTGIGWLIARAHRHEAERTQLALEQVLDRLEHGEIRPKHRAEPADWLFTRVVGEVRRAITEVTEPTRQPPRRLPPVPKP